MDKKSTRRHSSKKGVAAMKLSDQDKLHNLPFKKLFFVFLFGCVFGCIYETVLTFFMYLIGEGSIVIVSRSGLLYGPFNPVYGVGAALMVFFLARKDYKWW